MAYNGQLAKKLRDTFIGTSRVEEKKMMGGLTFMVDGKMCVGIAKDDLMVRLDPVVYDTVLKRKGCRKMDVTGKPMRGFVFVSPDGFKAKDDLDYWIDLALDFNKKAKAYKKKK